MRRVLSSIAGGAVVAATCAAVAAAAGSASAPTITGMARSDAVRSRPLVDPAGAGRLFATPGLDSVVDGTRSALGRLASASSSLSFVDAVGDAEGGPDITKVAVAGTSRTGAITVSVTAPGNRPASPDGLVRVVSVWLDTDNNVETGGDNGDDYVLVAYDDPADPAHWWTIAHWEDGNWVDVASTPTTTFDRGTDVLAWKFNRTDLGGAGGFALHVDAAAVDAGGEETAYDEAPAAGTWLYDISGPTRTTTLVLKPTIGKPVAVPARARPGKRFTVSFRVTAPHGGKPKPLTRGTMVATPSVGGSTVPHTESFRGGTARLSFVVPNNARGKLLKVSVRIKASSYQEQGTWFDMTDYQCGALRISYVGRSSTRVAGFPVR